MRSRVSLTAALAVACCSTAALAGEPAPSFTPMPSWVERLDIPAPDPARRTAPTQLLLTNSQQRLTREGSHAFVRYAIVPQTAAGLASAGNVAMPWQSERQDMQIHWVDIVRGGQRISQLRPGEVLVLRREENLEKAMLDGIRTVVTPVRGLRIGDVVDVAVSYVARDKLVGSRPEDIVLARPNHNIVRIDQRVIHDDSLTARWAVPAGIPRPASVRRGSFTEHRLVRERLAPLDIDDEVPDRFRRPIIQFTTYPSWSTVVDELRPLFDEARRPKANSTLLPEAKRIAASSSDPAQRMMMALQLAQEEVRYIALLLGEGAYRPQTADDTWELRFGDCKGKTVMLLALLDALAIEAEPLLVSSRFDDRIEGSLPSLGLFDHVIVRAKLGGRDYFLDATDYGQRTLDDVAGSGFRVGLALRPGADLESLPQFPLSSPNKTAELTWDRRTAADKEVPFEARLRFTGWRAAEIRKRMINAENEDGFSDYLKSQMPVIANDNLELLGIEPVDSAGAFVARFAGKAAMDWAPFEGEQASRFGLSNATINWKPDFEHEGKDGTGLPFSIVEKPYWDRLTETVILPAGGRGFKLDVDPLDEQIVGVGIVRKVRQEGDQVIAVSDWKSSAREVAEKDAAAAKEAIARLAKNRAWIVGPKYRPAKD